MTWRVLPCYQLGPTCCRVFLSARKIGGGPHWAGAPRAPLSRLHVVGHVLRPLVLEDATEIGEVVEG